MSNRKTETNDRDTKQGTPSAKKAYLREKNARNESAIVDLELTQEESKVKIPQHIFKKFKM